MCFSATASFSVAAATAAIGIAAVTQATRPRELPVAIVPLLFAAQQTVEGVLWLQLTGAGDTGTVVALATTFLVYAEVLWPAYAALAVLLIEPDRRRRRVLQGLAVIGCVLAIYLLVSLLGNPPDAAIRGHSISYTSDVHPLSWQMVPYLLCTCGAVLISSHRLIQVFGAVVAVGFLVSAYVYMASFISVWCFFAAADSTLLYFYFRRRAALGAPLRHR